VAGRDFNDGPANFGTSQNPPAGDSISTRGDIWKGESLLHDTGLPRTPVTPPTPSTRPFIKVDASLRDAAVITCFAAGSAEITKPVTARLIGCTVS